jgi:hypothetical protein
LKALYVPGLDERIDEIGSEMIPSGRQDVDIRETTLRSKSQLSHTQSINVINNSGFSKQNSATQMHKVRDASAGARNSMGTPQPKPPRDRSNPVQTKILQQNNFF